MECIKAHRLHQMLEVAQPMRRNTANLGQAAMVKQKHRLAGKHKRNWSTQNVFKNVQSANHTRHNIQPNEETDVYVVNFKTNSTFANINKYAWMSTTRSKRELPFNLFTCTMPMTHPNQKHTSLQQTSSCEILTKTAKISGHRSLLA